MLQRARVLYSQDTNTVKGKLLTIRDWVRRKINENLENMIYKDDFSTIFCRNREKGVYIVYAHTHRDAQKALRKLMETLNTGGHHE